MLEQEIKILRIDTEILVTKLLKFGAKRVFSGFITDTVFVHPSKKMSYSMRVRKQNAQRLVTFKKPIPSTEYKQALEIEVALYNPEKFLATLHEQGFTAKQVRHKMRVSYVIDSVGFDIDCIGNLPPLLEIESKSKKDINVWIQKLGLSKHQKLITGYNGLMKHYQKKTV